MYRIYCNDLYSTENKLADAILDAQELFDTGRAGEIEKTVILEDEFGDIVGSISPLPIIGTFTKQQWVGSRQDYLEDVDSQEFDATNHVLRMAYADVIDLADRSMSTDEVGLRHVSWDGPCAVVIVDEICRYFGVDKLDEITEENFEFVRNRVKPVAPHSKDLVLTVQLRVTSVSEIDVEQLIENLKLTPATELAGITFGTTKIQVKN